MEQGKTPRRTCVACRQEKDRRGLIRVVKMPDGIIAVDSSQKANGRGAYVCMTSACVALACKKRLLNRSMRCNIPQPVYDEIQGLVGGDGE